MQTFWLWQFSDKKKSATLERPINRGFVAIVAIVAFFLKTFSCVKPRYRTIKNPCLSVCLATALGLTRTFTVIGIFQLQTAKDTGLPIQLSDYFNTNFFPFLI